MDNKLSIVVIAFCVLAVLITPVFGCCKQGNPMELLREASRFLEWRRSNCWGCAGRYDFVQDGVINVLDLIYIIYVMKWCSWKPGDTLA